MKEKLAVKQRISDMVAIIPFCLQSKTNPLNLSKENGQTRERDAYKR